MGLSGPIIFLADAIFGELGRCLDRLKHFFVKLSSFLTWYSYIMITLRGRCDTSDASGQVAWQAQYFRNLDEKAAETEVLSHFRLSLLLTRAKLCEISICALASFL